MEMQLGKGDESVEMMQQAVSRLLDGIGDLKRLCRHLQSEDWPLVHTCGEELGKEALSSLCAGGLFLESVVNAFAVRPLRKLKSGIKLSESEYHALRAFGSLPNIEQMCGISTEGEYGTYCRLYYDGGHPRSRGLVMPMIFLDRHGVCDPRTGARIRQLDFGPVHVHNASRSHLDDYQTEFFQRHFPEDLEVMQP